MRKQNAKGGEQGNRESRLTAAVTFAFPHRSGRRAFGLTGSCFRFGLLRLDGKYMLLLDAVLTKLLALSGDISTEKSKTGL